LKLSLLCLASLLVVSSAWAAKELVNGVVASVGTKPITLRDVEFYRSVQRFKEGSGSLFAKESAEDRKKTIQRIALEEMVGQEMKSFRFSAEGKSEAEKIVRARRAADKSGSWKRLLSEYGKSEEAVIASLTRSLEVDKFLQTKIETLTPVITDSEVERFYRQNPGRYPGGDLESNRGQIVRDLKFERMQKALEEWVQNLREKYKFVNLVYGTESEKKRP